MREQGSGHKLSKLTSEKKKEEKTLFGKNLQKAVFIIMEAIIV
jgi:hypothetical protein